MCNIVGPRAPFPTAGAPGNFYPLVSISSGMRPSHSNAAELYSEGLCASYEAAHLVAPLVLLRLPL